jgi:hypothetical protein
MPIEVVADTLVDPDANRRILCHETEWSAGGECDVTVQSPFVVCNFLWFDVFVLGASGDAKK